MPVIGHALLHHPSHSESIHVRSLFNNICLLFEMCISMTITIIHTQRLCCLKTHGLGLYNQI